MTDSDDELAAALGVFTVMMIGVLRGPFEQWLAQRGLKLFQIPDSDVWTTTPTDARILRTIQSFDNGERE